MENSQTDTCLLHLLRQLHQRHQSTSHTYHTLLIEQKLIYTALLMEKGEGWLEKMVIGFVQRANQMAMEQYQLQTGENRDHQKLINKAIAILSLPNINSVITSKPQLDKLLILCFNNLSCILKSHKKYSLALRSITKALTLQQQLLKHEDKQQRYDIVTTYLNKAAILSLTGRHIQAIEVILKAREYVQGIQGQLGMQIRDGEEGTRLMEKRYYGMYMKMIIFYNLAAQKEHLKINREAVQYYKQSKQIAIIIDNKLMNQKLTHIIAELTNH